MKITKALKHSLSTAADKGYQPGDDVLVWRERQVNTRIGEWIGPFKLFGMDSNKKLGYVQDVNFGNRHPLNCVQVNRYYSALQVSQSLFWDVLRILHYTTSNEDLDCDILMTEILDLSDHLAKSDDMGHTKMGQIRGLLNRGTFKIILQEDAIQNTNVLHGRFVFATHSTEDGTSRCKARYVIGGHRDRMNSMIGHDSATLQPQSIRFLLTLAESYEFKIWTSDVRHAYLKWS